MTEGKHYQVWRTWLERGHLHHTLERGHDTLEVAIAEGHALARESVATLMVEVVEEPGSRVVWIIKGRR